MKLAVIAWHGGISLFPLCHVAWGCAIVGSALPCGLALCTIRPTNDRF